MTWSHSSSVLWCYLRNPAFATEDADYHTAADLTGQANHLGVTIEADMIKQKPPTTNHGYTTISFGKTDSRVYSALTPDSGDVVIMLIAFWSVAAVAKSRQWFRTPDRRQIAGFVVVGLLITVGMEEVSLQLDRWRYGEWMPTVPLLGTGLVPLAQWILLPLGVLWLVRRQLLPPAATPTT